MDRQGQEPGRDARVGGPKAAAPVALVASALVRRMLPTDAPSGPRAALRPGRLGHAGGGARALFVFIDRTGHGGLAPASLAGIALFALVTFAAFLAVEARLPEPTVDLRPVPERAVLRRAAKG